MMRLRPFFLILCLLTVASCQLIPKAIDLNLSAQEGNDATALLGGCGQKARDGYLFCRAKEGASSEGQINLWVPESKCKRDNCAEFQILNKDGSYGYGAGIKKGESYVNFPISKIIQDSKTIEKANEGEYAVLVRVWYEDKNGEEFTMYTKGIIRILVTAKNYVALKCDDPQLGWDLPIDKKCLASISTGFRTSLCGDCE